MNTTIQTVKSEEIVIGVNRLQSNGQISGKVCYQLGSQELVPGCLLDDAISDGWEECEEADEDIVVQTPGLDKKGWEGDLSYYCQLYRKLDADNSGDGEDEAVYIYQELFIANQDDAEIEKFLDENA
jgi:hypothetical protein